jgi:hypothetical protein
VVPDAGPGAGGLDSAALRRPAAGLNHFAISDR